MRAWREQVLASLPEIDDPKLVLPRLSSLQGLMETEDQFMDSFLTGENKSENGSRSAEVESSPDFKRTILMESLQRGMHLRHQQQHQQHPQHQQQPQQHQHQHQSMACPAGMPFKFHGNWKVHRTPEDNVNTSSMEQPFHRPPLDLRPGLLSLRPGSDSPVAMRQMENGMRPLDVALRTISDEEVQSSFRSSPMRFSNSTSTASNSNNNNNNEGLESIFSFNNYDPQQRATINALLPASTSAGGSPNSNLGFLAPPHYASGHGPGQNYTFSPAPA